MILLLAGCNATHTIFSSKSPHDVYSGRLTAAKLDETALGKAWITAAAEALQQPVQVTLPYKETGYFGADLPAAQGYRFTARRGENIEVVFTKNATRRYLVFIDLWEMSGDNTPKLLASMDTSGPGITHTVKDDGVFLLRLQPELLTTVDFTITIKTAPSLSFPVSVQYQPKIGSFWGAQRDAGARSHEGLDIFGRFRTPVIAAADGEVTSVTLNRLGGKVVFMRPSGKNYVLYYAHLDSQTVQQGQRVRMGDTLGLMGNTGNAKNTPTHLHFGIYAPGGAVDPLPYVAQNRPEPAAVTGSLTRLGTTVRFSKSSPLFSTPDKNNALPVIHTRNTVADVYAATGSWYRVRMPDNSQGYIPSSLASELSPIRLLTLPRASVLFDRPDTTGVPKTKLESGLQMKLLGHFRNQLYVKGDSTIGWVNEKL